MKTGYTPVMGLRLEPGICLDVDVHKLAVVSKVDMSEFKELYKAFIESTPEDNYNRKHLEFDEESKSFWLVWGDDSLYVQS